MRKQTKLVAVLSAAALLAVGASMVVSAKGWTEENGEWYYTDANGNYVYDTWKQSGSSWFYLGSDGAMVKDALINDSNNNYYYVDSNGVRVSNKWVEVESDDYSTSAEDTDWYYFQGSGRAYKNTSNDGLFKRVIDGQTYAFDDEGKMLYGWVDENGNQLDADESNPYENGLYYFNTEHDGSFGAMTEGWLALDNSFDSEDYEDQDVLYFYFQSSGKKVELADDSTDAYKTKTINGLKYAFDENGVMLYDWQLSTANDATSNDTDIQYFSGENDGHMKKNKWVKAVPSEELHQEDYDNGEERWFYINNSGDAAKNEMKKINGKYYLFDQYGRMKGGLWVVNTKVADGGSVAVEDFGLDDYTANEAVEKIAAALQNGGEFYYFGGDGDRKSGTYQLEFVDDTYTMVFNTNGTAKGTEKSDHIGENQILSNKVYNCGFLVKATVDDKYVPVETTEGTKVVNTSGSVVKGNSVVRDGNDEYLVVLDGNYAAAFSDSKVASAYKACDGNKDNLVDSKGKFKYKDENGDYIESFDSYNEKADVDTITLKNVSK